MKWFPCSLLSVLMLIAFHSTALAGAGQDFPTKTFLPEWPTTISSYGGKLLLSDSPEIVPNDGIMYQDVVDGDIRLFFHHVNGTSEPKKVVVLLENATDKLVHVTVSQYGLAGPSYDYLEVGKKVQLDYITGQDVYLLSVAAKEAKSLSTSLEDSIVAPNMLVNGMYDFKTDGPVNVKVMMMSVEADVREFASKAKVLPADVGQYRLRGTFEGKDRLVVPGQTYDAEKHGIVAFTLADNKLDPYVTGIDATDGTATTNYGNYGIVYKVFTPTVARGKMSYYLNPRGGEYAGWLGLNYRHQGEITIATPADKTSFGTTVHDKAYLGTYDGGKSLWMTFSPPGASNLPIKVIIAPGK